MLSTALISHSIAAVRDDGSFVPRLLFCAFLCEPEKVNLFRIVGFISTYFIRLLFMAHCDGWPLNSDHLSWGLRLIFLAFALQSLLNFYFDSWLYLDCLGLPLAPSLDQLLIVPMEGVDLLWVFFERGEHFTFLAGLRVLQGLEVLNLAALTLCHFIPEEILLDRAYIHPSKPLLRAFL